MSVKQLTISIISILILIWFGPNDASSFARQYLRTTSANPATQFENSIRHRLRISWGGGEAKQWQGKLKFIHAEVSKPSTIGFSHDSASFVKYEKHEVVILQSSASAFEGFDVDVVGRSDSRLIVEIAEQGGEPVTREYALSKISEQDQVFVVDDDNNRFSIARAPGDMLQFKTDRKHLVFEPGESFVFEFRAMQLRRRNVGSQCDIEIFAAREEAGGTKVNDVQLAFDSLMSSQYVQQTIEVPREEGVYNLRLSIGGASAEAVRFGRRPEPVVREIQFIVVDPDNRFAESGAESLVSELNPADLRGSPLPQQLNQLSRMIGIRSESASSGNFRVERNDNNEQSVVLPVGGWQAIPIAISEVGKQHRIEIEYPASQPMAMGLSVLQPDASGQVPHFGAESGVKVSSGIGAGNAGINGNDEMVTHRFVFWPEDEQAILLIANRDQKKICRYGKIRVFRVDEAVEAEGIADQRMGTRKQMLFYEQPLFIDNFAAHHFYDEQFGQPITDWVTFFKGINRLATYIKDSGAGGAFINVLGEGSALMPLETLLPNPRYDSGEFSSLGHDPVRKDVVELIYRIFEREGLAFVPVLAFDHRLSQIEFNSQPDHSLLNSRGQPVAVDESGTHPIYNPLSSSVQQSVNEVIAEFSDRYRGRASFQGVAVICRPDTCTLLPGSTTAGYDELTVQKFNQWQIQNGSNVDSESADLLAGENFSKWLQWRQLQMSNWYRQMERIVIDKNSQSKLYLAFVDLFRNDEIASVMSPTLHRDVDVGQAMLRLGLDAELTTESTNIVMMQPRRFAPIHALASKRSDTVADSTDALSDWFAQGSYPASLFSQRSAWARFEKLEGSSHFAQQNQPILRLQQINPGGDWNRERFSRALLKSDARLIVDGGVSLNTVVDEDLKQFLAVYSALPDAVFNDVVHLSQPEEKHSVAVRYLRIGSSLYSYCVNASPWPVTTQIRFRGDGQKLIDSQIAADNGSQSSIANRAFRLLADGVLEARIPPFGLVGMRCEDYSVRLTDFDYRYNETAQNELRDSYYKLRSRLIASGNANDIGVLHNPGFENGGLLNGWSNGDSSGRLVQLQSQGAHQGGGALRINNQGNSSVWVRSNQFEPTQTGRLSISVWMRTDNEQQQPPLRISIESSDPESEYYRFAELGSLVADKRMNQVTSQWKRYAVHFDDLPQEKTAAMRIGFDMMGPGQVWIDDVQVYDRWLDEKDLKAMTQIFASVGPMIRQQEKLEQCRQLLNGYWPLFLREYFDDATVIAGNKQTDSEVKVIAETPPNKTPLRSSMRKRFRRLVSPGIFQFR